MFGLCEGRVRAYAAPATRIYRRESEMLAAVRRHLRMPPRCYDQSWWRKDICGGHLVAVERREVLPWTKWLDSRESMEALTDGS